MLKKFKDFNVEEYKHRRILESADVVDDVVINSNDPDFDEKLVSDDKILSKMSNVVYNALNKNGFDNYKPSSLAISINGIPGVLFRNCKDINKCIVACRNQYKKVIIVFDKFEIGKKNKAVATYSSDEMGFMDMVKYAIEDLKDVRGINEAADFRASTGYGMGHVKKYIAFPSEIKDFMVKLVNENGGPKVRSINTLCVKAIEKGFHLDDPMCKDLIELINPKDPSTIPSTLKYFVAITVDAMNKTYPEVADILDDDIEIVGGGPEKSVGDLYDAEERDKKKEERRMKKLEKANKKFKQSMDIIMINCDAYCKYVKNNGIIKKDFMKGMSKRGMYITGKAGTGKTHTINKVLRDNAMVENRDYVKLGNVPTTAPDLFRLCYKYNGKLIIFDDSANMVEGSNRVAFWKQLLQTGGGMVDYPRSTREDSEEFYDIKGKTRQQRYFEEIGKKTSEQKREFIDKRLKKYKARTPRTEWDLELADSQAEEAWKEEEAKIKPRIPNKFEFTGCVIIIGNTTFEDLAKSIQSSGMSNEDWVAVQDRMALVDVTPPATTMWESIQLKIRDEQKMSETEKPSDECLVPRKYADRFIDEVNLLLSGEEDDEEYVYQRITFRTADSIGSILKGTDDIEDFYWKEMLRSSMRVNRKDIK